MIDGGDDADGWEVTAAAAKAAQRAKQDLDSISLCNRLLGRSAAPIHSDESQLAGDFRRCLMRHRFTIKDAAPFVGVIPDTLGQWLRFPPLNPKRTARLREGMAKMDAAAEQRARSRRV